MEYGFFPSMLPPVSPISSVMNATGISADANELSGNHLQLDNLVMPEAMPTYSITPPEPKRFRKPWQEQRDLMNGNISGSRTLETVVEHSSLEVDDSTANYSKSALVNLTNSSSGSDKHAFVFPSATDSPVNSHKIVGKTLGNQFDALLTAETNFSGGSEYFSADKPMKHERNQTSTEHELFQSLTKESQKRNYADKDVGTNDSRSMLQHTTESQETSATNYPHTLFVSPSHQSWKRPMNKQDSLELIVTDDQLTAL